MWGVAANSTSGARVSIMESRISQRICFLRLVREVFDDTFVLPRCYYTFILQIFVSFTVLLSGVRCCLSPFTSLTPSAFSGQVLSTAESGTAGPLTSYSRAVYVVQDLLKHDAQNTKVKNSCMFVETCRNSLLMLVEIISVSIFLYILHFTSTFGIVTSNPTKLLY